MNHHYGSPDPPRTLTERLANLNDNLQSLGERLKASIAAVVGDAFADAVRDSVRGLLGGKEATPTPYRDHRDHHAPDYYRDGADVTRAIQRLFERNADLFPIRDKGGCYFVPERHSAFVDKIDRFVKGLNGSLRRFPVPSGTPHGDRSVKEAVASGIETLIREHDAAVDTFGEDTRPDTRSR